jgi:hypothetical protein
VNDDDILAIGNMLEGKGLSHSDIDAYFLEHYGVQGMKWGQRRAANRASRTSLREQGLSRRTARKTVRTQNNIDKVRMAATGRQGKVSVLRQLSNEAFSNQRLSPSAVLNHPLSTRNAAQYQLRRSSEAQQRILSGEDRVQGFLARMSGISVANLDFSVDS